MRADGPRSPRRSRNIRLALGGALCVALLWWLISRAGVSELVDVLKRTDWTWLALGLSVKGFGYFIRAVRWAAAIGASTRKPDRRVFAASMVGHAANVVLPARLGDFARAELLVRHNEVTRALALSCYWVCSVIDYLLFAAVLLCLTLLSGLGGIADWRLSLIVLLCAAGAFAGLWILGASGARQSRLQRLAWDRISTLAPKRLQRHLSDARDAASLLRKPRHVAVAFALSVAVLLSEVGGTALMMEAFSIPGGLTAAMAVSAALSLSFVFPLTPGNVGTHQLICTLVLALWNCPEASALAFSIGMQGSVMLLLVTLGAAFFFREGANWLQAPALASAPLEGFSKAPR